MEDGVPPNTAIDFGFSIPVEESIQLPPCEPAAANDDVAAPNAENPDPDEEVEPKVDVVEPKAEGFEPRVVELPNDGAAVV